MSAVSTMSSNQVPVSTEKYPVRYNEEIDSVILKIESLNIPNTITECFYNAEGVFYFEVASLKKENKSVEVFRVDANGTLSSSICNVMSIPQKGYWLQTMDRTVKIQIDPKAIDQLTINDKQARVLPFSYPDANTKFANPKESSKMESTEKTSNEAVLSSANSVKDSAIETLSK